MMPITMLGAVLLALLLSLTALFHDFHRSKIRRDWRSPLLMFQELYYGTSGLSIAFYARGANGMTVFGSSTPPTAIQAAQCSTMKALIGMVDADTQALFTHNYGVDASSPAFGDPAVLFWPQLQGPLTASFIPLLTFDLTNTNVVKVNKPNLGGSAMTFWVELRRPHSTGQ